MAILSKADKEKLLRKFAKYLGGVDADGTEYFAKLGEEEKRNRQRQHLFWVRHLDIENPAGVARTGDIVLDLIKEGKHSVDYLGLSANAVRGRGTKRKILNKSLQKKLLEEIDDQMSGLRRRDRAQGIYEEDEHYEAKAASLKEKAKKSFE